MIPDEVVERVQEAADIVQIIGEHVKLKKTGADYRGPCPFHQGKDNNFSVSPRRGIYYCFVCSEGGNVFRFLQKRLDMTYPEAIRFVGEKVGVDVPEFQTRREGPDPREPFWELNAAAADYFRNMLWEDPCGHGARNYLQSRDISRELAEETGIGYAPSDMSLMRDYLAKLGFDDARMLETGLLAQRDEAGAARPRFRDRLMFPILDGMARHVGFGGRVLGTREPKYLNSPESPVFSKGKMLYALSWAKNEIRREDRALVVEGYFDVLRLRAVGVRSAVAPMGTALTEAQATLIRKYTKNVILLYDNDRGGLAATFRSGDELLRHGFSVRVVTLPEGDDPDSFARREGAAGIEREISSSIDVFERKVQLLQRAGAFNELHKKRGALDNLLPTMRAASDPVMRELYVARASEISGIDRAVVQREIDLAVRGSPRAHTGVPQQSREVDIGQSSEVATVRGPSKRRHADAGHSAERELIRAMLRYRHRVTEIVERVGPNIFRDPHYREIFERLLESDEETAVETIALGLSEGAIREIEALLAEHGAQVDVQRTVEDSLTSIQIRDLKEEMKRMQALITLASTEEKDDIMKRRAQTRDEILRLNRTRSEAASRS